MASYHSVEDLKIMRRAVEDAKSDAAKYRQWARSCDLDAERYQRMLDRALGRLALGRVGEFSHEEHKALAREAEAGYDLRKARVERLGQPCPGCGERCGQCAEDALD